MKTEMSSTEAAEQSGVHESVLRGRKVLLVGGDPRPSQQSAIERQLGVAKLRWLDARPTSSLSRLKKVVASEQYDVVIVALRWARYGFSELAHVCSEHGIAFVRLPGGINPGQIAFRANAQIGQRLAAIGPV